MILRYRKQAAIGTTKPLRMHSQPAAVVPRGTPREGGTTLVGQLSEKTKTAAATATSTNLLQQGEDPSGRHDRRVLGVPQTGYRDTRDGGVEDFGRRHVRRHDLYRAA